MFCSSCGAHLSDGSKFCEICGAKQTEVDDSLEKNAVTTLDQDKNTDKEKSEKKNANKKKNNKKRTVLMVIGILLLLVVTVVGILMFPLKITVIDPEETQTQLGYFDELIFAIDANQPIQSVSYALDPENKNNDECYTDLVLSENDGKQTVIIEDLKVPVGESTLFLRVDTIFGQAYHEVELEFDFGYVADFDPNNIVTMDDGGEIVEGELLVVTKDSMSERKAKKLFSEYGGEIIGQIYALNQYQVFFSDAYVYELESIAEELRSNSDVVSVCYNNVIQQEVSVFPDDKKYDKWDTAYPSGNNWALECIDAPGAWEYNDQMSTIKVGVIDSVLDYDHPDLEIDSKKGSFLPTNDFKTLKSLMSYYNEVAKEHSCTERDCDFCGNKDHGTHVSGIIGAIANNGKGVSGVNWNADIYFANRWYYSKPADSDDYLNQYSTFSGLVYQISRLVMDGCRVVNLSLGGSVVTTAIDGEENMVTYYENVISRMEDSGYDFLIVKAAGNMNVDADGDYLNRIFKAGDASEAHTIIVAAIVPPQFSTGKDDWQYSVASYSNYGELVDIAAPGSSVYSTVFDGYDYMSGTSMAAPMVTGAASLLYSLDSSLTYDKVKELLTNSTDNYCSKSTKKMYPILNVKMAVEKHLGNGTNTPEADVPTVGFVTGLIQNAQTEEIINSATVLLMDTKTEKIMTATVDGGMYHIWVEPGVYNMKFEATGYQSEMIYGVEVQEGVVNYNILLNMVGEAENKGRVSGRVVDAFDASTIHNVKLKVYSGVNNTSGTPVVELDAENGLYELELLPGNYTLCANAKDYTAGSANILVVADEHRGNQDCTLTPVLKNGEIRVVLTWGEFPLDLDSHIVGPTPDGERFHVYFKEPDYYYDRNKYVNLDVDDTSSYGPETTSVYIPVNGTYTFYVHDFSNSDYDQSTRLSTSGAKVTVYLAGQAKPYVFYVPNEEGTLWEVFSVKEGALTPINEMGYQKDARLVGRDG